MMIVYVKFQFNAFYVTKSWSSKKQCELFTEDVKAPI